MKIFLLVFVPLLASWSVAHEPCSKQHKHLYSRAIITNYYMDCNDTSTYVSRRYLHDTLVYEAVVKNNVLIAERSFIFEKGKSLISVETCWKDNAVINSSSYYTNGVRRVNEQMLDDSMNLYISYYANGRLKEMGTQTYAGCRTGVWQEYDSLDLAIWTGRYKRVQKQIKEGAVTFLWCYEKDGEWLRTNNQGKVIEKRVFMNGKLKMVR